MSTLKEDLQTLIDAHALSPREEAIVQEWFIQGGVVDPTLESDAREVLNRNFTHLIQLQQNPK